MARAPGIIMHVFVLCLRNGFLKNKSITNDSMYSRFHLAFTSTDFLFCEIAYEEETIIVNSVRISSSVQGYSVVLPEKLQTGKWNVYRYAIYML